MSLTLPPGWTSQWDETHQRPLFIQTETGHTQWEPPTDIGAEQQPAAAPAPTGGSSRRRVYATGQTQAYYGNPEDGGYGGGAQGGYGGGTQGGYGGAGQGYGGVAGNAAVDPAGQPGGQLFTPGNDAGAQGFGATQGAGGGYYAPEQDPGYGPAGYPQQGAGYPQQGGGQGGYPQHGAVNAMADQFAGMGLGGQKPYGMHTINLLTTLPEPHDLTQPPPEIRLPPGAALSHSPNINADPSYMRSTLNAVPTTSTLLNKTKIPFGLTLTPYRSVKEGEEQVPVITDTVIARCRRCRSYINPYVQFIDGGSRWKCCMCHITNEVPQMFDWDQINNRPGDRWARHELNNSVVEYVAPTEYMVRAPQPPVYVFLIDVGHAAVQSGMVATATRTILESLDRLPNEDGRTKVAFIGFDTSLHFFALSPTEPEPQILVVSDIDDPFLPKPQDLLVNLNESRAAVEALLQRMGDMFAEGVSGGGMVGNAMGSALMGGFKMISHIGGKMIVLSNGLPTLGIGALKDREDSKLLGTPKESSLLQPASSWYKTFAIDCSRALISVDMYLFSSTYTDIATLSCLPHYTSGQTYFYPAFNASRSEDALKFAHEFGEVLASPIGLEAITRIRASKGLRIAQFHGNFFVRSTDLLSMPAVPVDQGYAVEVEIEENLATPIVVFQTAVLHTTCYGERRIRVVTLALPTTSNISDVYASADQVAIATLLANKAVERSMSSKLEDARDAVTNKLVDIMGTFKANMTAAGAGASAALSICENLKMLPVLLLGLLKHVGLRQSSQIPSDLRAYAQALLTSLPSQLLMPYIHPTFYSLHNMAPEAGTVGEHGVIMPQALPLTSERLERHGLFLIEDGQSMFLWVGKDAVPQLILDVFNLPSYDQLRGGKTTLPLLENAFSQRINAVIAKTREMRRGPYRAHIYVVKEDGEPPLRLWALSALIQDRAEQSPSYMQFISMLKDRVNNSNY